LSPLIQVSERALSCTLIWFFPRSDVRDTNTLVATFCK